MPPRTPINPGDQSEAERINTLLVQFGTEVESLAGIVTEPARSTLVAQLIDSIRRNIYVQRIRSGNPSEGVLRPLSSAFDPQRGAVLRAATGDFDDACWLIFLSVHFGRHRVHRWALTGRFYGRLGQGGLWDWHSVRRNVDDVRFWLDANEAALKEGGVAFGNHRKYESLNGTGHNGTGATIESYVDWIGESHAERFAMQRHENVTATDKFRQLYDSLDNVIRFGRTARFDFLSTLAKLGLVAIAPDSAHLAGSTGPVAGARLLFDGDPTSDSKPVDLEARLARLQQWLGLPFDVLEDALCNWQKSPNSYVGFRG